MAFLKEGAASIKSGPGRASGYLSEKIRQRRSSAYSRWKRELFRRRKKRASVLKRYKTNKKKNSGRETGDLERRKKRGDYNRSLQRGGT